MIDSVLDALWLVITSALWISVAAWALRVARGGEEFRDRSGRLRPAYAAAAALAVIAGAAAPAALIT